MRTLHRIFPTLAAVLFVAAGSLTSPARAATAQVADNGGFFSAGAVTQANQQLADIEQRTGRDLRIETYPEIPAEMRSRFSPDRQAQFFADWAEQRGQQAGVRGVIVLICRDPSYLTVQIGRQTRQSGAFTDADKNRLRDLLAGAFKAKNFDQGLSRAVEFFGTTVQNAAPAAPAPAASNGGGSTGGSSSGTPAPYRLPTGP